jgi:quinolinate synthase
MTEATTIAPIRFDAARAGSDAECEARIVAARRRLGDRAVILGHHYQRAEVYRHAELTGDSLKLARLAAQTDAEFIVFCGVHFMAEVADILSRPHQKAILPDLSAGCSMADMANLRRGRARLARTGRGPRSGSGRHAGHLHQLGRRPQGLLRRAWRHRLHQQQRPPASSAGPSAAATRCCSSPTSTSGAGPRTRWVCRWMSAWCGTSTEPLGGLTPEQIRKARVLLWKGHCSVHQMFQGSHIERFRADHPQGRVISHPECSFEVCAASDLVGSTEFILNTVHAAEPGSHWLVGTELNLVDRSGAGDAAEGRHRAVHVADGLHVLDHGAHRPAAPRLVPGTAGRGARRQPHRGAASRSRTGAAGARPHAVAVS